MRKVIRLAIIAGFGVSLGIVEASGAPILGPGILETPVVAGPGVAGSPTDGSTGLTFTLTENDVTELGAPVRLTKTNAAGLQVDVIVVPGQQKVFEDPPGNTRQSDTVTFACGGVPLFCTAQVTFSDAQIVPPPGMSDVAKEALVFVAAPPPPTGQSPQQTGDFIVAYVIEDRDIDVVPEPSTWSLVGLGLTTILIRAWRRHSKSRQLQFSNLPNF
jgi:hypothetical protein